MTKHYHFDLVWEAGISLEEWFVQTQLCKAIIFMSHGLIKTVNPCRFCELVEKFFYNFWTKGYSKMALCKYTNYFVYFHILVLIWRGHLYIL